MKLNFLLLALSLACLACELPTEKGKETAKTEKTSGNSEKKKPEEKKPDVKKWYEGGTLHKCTNAEWKKASKENKIATCADFIFTLAKSDGVTVEDFKRLMPDEKFKSIATKMSEELDEGVATGVSSDTVKGEVAAYASLYWMMLKAQTNQ